MHFSLRTLVDLLYGLFGVGCLFHALRRDAVYHSLFMRLRHEPGRPASVGVRVVMGSLGIALITTSMLLLFNVVQ
jgi:hypothetical protein